MQIQWLQRTLRYWNKLVANKAESELLDLKSTKFVLAAEVWQGLHEDHDHDCWAKDLDLFGRADVCGPQQRLEDPHAAVVAN